MRIGLKGIAALAVVALIVGLAGAAFATVSTDQADYSPGSTVTISGDNGNGAGYTPGENVQVQVSGPNGYASSCKGIVNDAGTWSCQVTLNNDDSAVGSYTYTAFHESGVPAETGTFTDAPKQDDPPPTTSPPTTSQPTTSSVGSDTVTWTGQGVGADNSTCNSPNDSGLLNPVPVGQKGWLFVLNQITGDPSDWRLDVDFNPGINDDELNIVPVQTTQNVAKWAVYSDPNATINGATAHATSDGGTSDGELVVSHCYTNTGAPQSSLRTEVHGPNGVHNEVTSVSLGQTVHDEAFVTYANGTLGSGAAVSFVLLTNSTDCTTGSPGTPETLPIGTSPAQVKSTETAPLAVGNYAYQVTFDSGTGSLIPDQGPKCEPFTVTPADTSTTTQVHDAGHQDITNGSVTLGSVVHDQANISGGVSGFPITGTVTFSLYNSSDCTGDHADEQVVFGAGDDPTNVESSDTAALAAGQYGYLASYSGDSNYNGSTELSCEPFTVTKSGTKTTTEVHDAAHHDITNNGVQMGSYVHDKASVAGDPAVPSFAVDGTVTFSLYKNSGCTGTPLSVEPDVTIGSNPTDGTASTPTKITEPGSYGYQATYSGNGNYNVSTGVCEPFSVFQPGKTMGYWGNKNGQKNITDNGGYPNNPVNIGRGANIDSSAKSLKVLPNTLNACGKGSPVIFTVGAQTANTDCTLANGVNKSSLNTLAAQTLALGYNLKPALRPGFAGQTIGQLQCTAYLTAGLTGTSTVNDAFNAAVALINGSAAGGTTTQTQIGGMNSLLGCLNREA